MKGRRVVVTGVGVVSPVGVGRERFWQALMDGESGISDVPTFFTDKYGRQRGGVVRSFVSSSSLSPGMGRASQFAITASTEAVADAGISPETLKGLHAGTVFGTTNGESNILEEVDRIWMERGESEVWGRTLRRYPLDSIARNVAAHHGLRDFVQMIPTACAAGNYSIGLAYDLIATGRADLMIAGGSDPLTRYAFAGFGRLFAMAPEKCQPFDKNRKGMLVGEGAAALVLEDEERARLGGRKPYAEVCGYGLSCDANHMTAPSMEGISKVMRRALEHSGIGISDVDYISAHGTGTPANDKAESQAIAGIFGSRTSSVPVSSIKSMLGHTMGAASALEAVACCMAIERGAVPPTMNFDTPDPECPVDCVPNKARKLRVRYALNNSFAFGGNNACVVFGRYD